MATPADPEKLRKSALTAVRFHGGHSAKPDPEAFIRRTPDRELLFIRNMGPRQLAAIREVIPYEPMPTRTVMVDRFMLWDLIVAYRAANRDVVAGVFHSSSDTQDADEREVKRLESEMQAILKLHPLNAP